jgi:hypothetical protein
MFSGQVQTVKTFVLPRASHFFIIFIYLWLLLSVYPCTIRLFCLTGGLSAI